MITVVILALVGITLFQLGVSQGLKKDTLVQDQISDLSSMYYQLESELENSQRYTEQVVQISLELCDEIQNSLHCEHLRLLKVVEQKNAFTQQINVKPY